MDETNTVVQKVGILDDGWNESAESLERWYRRDGAVFSSSWDHFLEFEASILLRVESVANRVARSE